MITKYKLFIRPACDECMKIVEFMQSQKIKGDIIDVTDAEGEKAFKGMLCLAGEQGFKVNENSDGTYTFPICFFFDYNDIEKIAYTTEDAKRVLENKSLFDIV